MTSQFESLFASNRFTEIIAIHNDNLVVTELDNEDQLRIAASYFRVGEYDSAIRLLEEIAPFQGNSPDYLNLAAVTYRKIGHLQKAYQMLVEAEDIDPESLQIKNNKANVLLDLGKIDNAKTILSKVLDKSPDFEDAKVNLARAIHLEQELVDKDRSDSNNNTLLSFTDDPLLFAFEGDTVIADLERYQSRKSQNQGNNSGDNEEKLEKILSETDENQSFANETIKLSSIANQQNNIDDSLKLSTLAYVREKEINPIVFANVSDSYINKMRFKEAEIYALHSVVNGNTNPSIYLNLCTLCTLRSDYKLAKHYLNKAVMLDPSHPNIQDVKNNLQYCIKQSPKPIEFDQAWAKEKELNKT